MQMTQNIKPFIVFWDGLPLIAKFLFAHSLQNEILKCGQSQNIMECHKIERIYCYILVYQKYTIEQNLN